MSFKKLFIASVFITGIATSQAYAAHVGVGLEIGAAPPPPRVEMVPAVQPGYVWAPGYWSYEGPNAVWVPGRMIAERLGFHWVPEHWVQRGPRWHFVRGHWVQDAPPPVVYAPPPVVVEPAPAVVGVGVGFGGGGWHHR